MSHWDETKKRRKWKKNGENRTQWSSNEKAPCWPYRQLVMRVDSALRQQWYRNMAVSIARRPTANACAAILTFLTALIVQRSFADVVAGASVSEEEPHRRFEYKYSFKGPHLSQTDGSIPFWIHTGSKFVASCQHHGAGRALLIQHPGDVSRAHSRFPFVTDASTALCRVWRHERCAQLIQKCPGVRPHYVLAL